MALPDIFISYSRDDQATARRFAEGFERAGLNVWWDVTLKSGEAYDRVTERALRNARAVVTLWSKTSVNSDWVRAEATIGLRNKTLMPVMIEPCERPIMFELTHTPDLSHWTGSPEDAAWLSFATEVQELVARHATGEPRIAATAAAAMQRKPSIAVLPFANMSGDKEQEYFSDGLAEEIINALAQVPGLKVIARTSTFAFRGQNTDVRRIADTLNVTHVLEGSVRRAGNRIRVTTQLIDSTDGTHLWSERYDRELEDVFAVQDDIASAITAALQIKLAAAVAGKSRYTPKLPAYEALLKARHFHWKATAEAMDQARVYHEQALVLDPQYALAQVEYAEYLMARAFVSLSHLGEMAPLSRTWAQKALQLDPSLSDAHGPLCTIAACYDRDWKEAHRHFLLATADERSTPLARMGCAFGYLLPSGQVDAAIGQLQLAVQDDPLHIVCRSFLGLCLDGAGRHAEAESILQETMELSPDHRVPRLYLVYHYFNRQRLPEALAVAEWLFVHAPWYPQGVSVFAGLLSRSGQAARAAEVLCSLKPEVPGYCGHMASYYLYAGDIEQAADWMEKALTAREATVLMVLRMEAAKVIRASSRWPRLAQMMNLPEAGLQNATAV
jgi:TolB-like protein/Tfp pilus assembly protein PilF